MEPHIQTVQCKSILTATGGFLSSYTHTLNPYTGCGFGAPGGCGVYCYVAESPVGRFGPGPWGSWVTAKENAAVKLSEELGRRPDPERLRVFLGSATDPYQPLEGRLKLTQAVLSVFHARPVGLLVVQTRSPL